MTSSNQSPIIILTSGLCNTKTRVGTRNVLIKSDTKLLRHSLRVRQTTANELVLEATLRALESMVCYNGCHITVMTTSQYLVKGVTEWINKWEQNGWRNANKKPIPHKDKWIKLKSLSDQLGIHWRQLSKDEEPQLQSSLIDASDIALRKGAFQHSVMLNA